MIPNGAVIWARQTIDSAIFKKPDKWFKIWFFMVCKANHKETKQFKRGQCFLSYALIMDGTGCTKSVIDHAIRWLKRCQMLVTTKATRGFIVTIVNYDTYQNLDNYSGDTKSDTPATEKRQRSDTKATEKRHYKQECKNVKNDKKNTLAGEVKDYWNGKKNLPGVRLLTTKRKNKLSTRLKEVEFAENWQLIIDKISNSPFCTGDNSTGWKAVFDWIIHDEGNYMKVLEGNYDKRNSTQSQKRPDQGPAGQNNGNDQYDYTTHIR